MITKQQLKNICHQAKDENLDKYLPYLNMLMDEYEINTPNRRRHFIAQLAHESNQFNSCAEKYNGTPQEYFKKYDNRKDLGNSFKGDGMKFKGRGLIQITGRYNYSCASIDIFKDATLLSNPEKLEQPALAVEVSCWFWKTKHLNSLADNDEIKAITMRINGGLNGLNERIMFYNLAKKYIL
jgi:putative chitinase